MTLNAHPDLLAAVCADRMRDLRANSDRRSASARWVRRPVRRWGR